MLCLLKKTKGCANHPAYGITPKGVLAGVGVQPWCVSSRTMAC